MTWTEEVHRNQLRGARRRDLAAKPYGSSEPNSGVLPILLVSTLVLSSVWGRKGRPKGGKGSRRKPGNGHPVASWLDNALQLAARLARQASQQQRREQRSVPLAGLSVEIRLKASDR